MSLEAKWVEIVISDCCDTCFAALRPGMIVMFEGRHLYCKSCVEKGVHHNKRGRKITEEIEINLDTPHRTGV